MASYYDNSPVFLDPAFRAALRMQQLQNIQDANVEGLTTLTRLTRDTNPEMDKIINQIMENLLIRLQIRNRQAYIIEDLNASMASATRFSRSQHGEASH